MLRLAIAVVCAMLAAVSGAAAQPSLPGAKAN
jgi:hypothetical protein